MGIVWEAYHKGVHWGSLESPLNVMSAKGLTFHVAEGIGFKSPAGFSLSGGYSYWDVVCWYLGSRDVRSPL